MSNRSAITWTVGFTSDPAVEPDTFVPAQVPGAVQLDWGRHEGRPDPEWNPAFRPHDYLWMEDVYWLYRTRLDFTPPPPGQRLYLVCGGVDYQFQIALGGQVLHAQEGMLTPVEIDLTDRAKPGDVLEVLVFPAPKSRPDIPWTDKDVPYFRQQGDASAKPPVSYGWDFHPRLIPLGIWGDTFLETRPSCHIRAAEVLYELSDDLRAAAITLNVELSRPTDGSVRWTLRDRRGATVLQESIPLPVGTATRQLELRDPELWWPNGQGEPVLYSSSFELLGRDGTVIDRRDARVGFKRVRLVMGVLWDDPTVNVCPKGSNKAPITLEINGREIFTKGSNWVGPDLFPGRLGEGHYRPLLELAKAANFTLVRCWGGAAVQKDAFFDLCDEMGLMVWQEFPLACNRYEGSPQYLRVLDAESRTVIRRLRSRACLAIWCGGNELFNNWSCMTDQDLALRLLNRNTFDLDPHKPFIFTSPRHGMGHGYYMFLLDRHEVFEYFKASHCTAYTEFGVPATPGADTLRKIIPAADLFPPRARRADGTPTQWSMRHAFLTWDGDPGAWLDLACIESYFGKADSLEQLVERSQWMQAAGLKCIIEDVRRQKPFAAMALNWCFNEPWPTAANLSIVGWPAAPKPGYHAVAAACRNTLASAAVGKFLWHAGEEFAAELWMLNDAPTPVNAGQVEATLQVGDREIPLGTWNHPAIEANKNAAGPTLRATLPRAATDRLTLILRCKEHPKEDSRYTLAYRAE